MRRRSTARRKAQVSRSRSSGQVIVLQTIGVGGALCTCGRGNRAVLRAAHSAAGAAEPPPDRGGRGTGRRRPQAQGSTAARASDDAFRRPGQGRGGRGGRGTARLAGTNEAFNGPERESSSSLGGDAGNTARGRVFLRIEPWSGQGPAEAGQRHAHRLALWVLLWLRNRRDVHGGYYVKLDKVHPTTRGGGLGLPGVARHFSAAGCRRHHRRPRHGSRRVLPLGRRRHRCPRVRRGRPGRQPPITRGVSSPGPASRPRRPAPRLRRRGAETASRSILSGRSSGTGLALDRRVRGYHASASPQEAGSLRSRLGSPASGSATEYLPGGNMRRPALPASADGRHRRWLDGPGGGDPGDPTTGPARPTQTWQCRPTSTRGPAIIVHRQVWLGMPRGDRWAWTSTPPSSRDVALARRPRHPQTGP